MKVLFLAGGTPHSQNIVFNRLNNYKNIEVVLVAPRGKGTTTGAGLHQTQKGINFKIYTLDEYKTFYGKVFFKGLMSIIDEEKPNIIVSNWPYTLSFVFYPFFKWRLKTKGIKIISKEIPFQVPYYQDAVTFYSNGGGVTENNEAIQTNINWLSKLKFWFITEVRKRMVNGVDAHLNYYDEAVDIQKSYGVLPEKVFVLGNSPDTDILFQAKENIENLPKLLPKNNYRLIHVGRLVKWKRVDMIIDAVNELKQTYAQIELLVVGTGPEENNLKQQVKELHLESYVKFVGGIYENEELGRYLTESSIYVLAGMGGLSINDAMAFGLPVVCAVADGTEKKLVRENLNGHYFENGNTDSLTKTIHKMLADLPKTQQMGIESTRIIKEEVNINTFLSTLKNSFDYVLRKKA